MSHARGRPPGISAPLLYDFRRGKTLVDVLAQGADMDILHRLARAWELNELGVKVREIDGDDDALLQRMAKHCQEQYRKERR